MIDIPAVGLLETGGQRRARPPAERGGVARIHHLARRAVGARGVVADTALVAHHAADHVDEVADRHVEAGTEIDDALVGEVLHEVDHAVGGIVDEQELATHRAGAPHFHGGRMGELGLVRLDDQGRHDMALHQVEIVARAIEIGRHDGDEVAAVLPAVGLAQLDAGDLGDGVPLVGRLQRAGEQRRLGNRLRRQARIDARGTEQHQLLDAGAARGLHDVRLDHQIVVDELGRPRVVGVDAADPRRRQEHRLRPGLAQPAFELLGIAQVHRLARGRHDLAALAFEAAHQRAADQPAMAGDPNPLIAQRVGRVGHNALPCLSG